MPRLFRITTVLLSLVSLAACGDSGPTDQGQRLVALGRLERGATVRMVAREGETAADSLVSDVMVTPASAGVVTGASVRFVQSGSVTVAARTANGGTITAALDIALPPTVYFDAVAGGNRDVYGVTLDGVELKRWTSAAGDDSHPTVAGGTMVFSTARHGNGELYAIALASGSEQRLTTTPANETAPALAKSGASIAFVSDVSGTSRVMVAAMPFANAVRLTASSAGSGVSLEANPTWSPTTDRIAFMSTVTGDATLFITSAAAGSVPTPVSGSNASQAGVEPSWSPDGNFIAFASSVAGSSQIYVLDLRTGALRQLTSGASQAGQPGWLADGRLVFTQFAGSETELRWVDPVTSEPSTKIPTGSLSQAGHATGAR